MNNLSKIVIFAHKFVPLNLDVDGFFLERDYFNIPYYKNTRLRAYINTFYRNKQEELPANSGVFHTVSDKALVSFAGILSGVFAMIAGAQTVRTTTKWSDGSKTVEDDHSTYFMFKI